MLESTTPGRDSGLEPRAAASVCVCVCTCACVSLSLCVYCMCVRVAQCSRRPCKSTLRFSRGATQSAEPTMVRYTLGTYRPTRYKRGAADFEKWFYEGWAGVRQPITTRDAAMVGKARDKPLRGKAIEVGPKLSTELLKWPTFRCPRVGDISVRNGGRRGVAHHMHAPVASTPSP